jgi:hypothetical protein
VMYEIPSDMTGEDSKAILRGEDPKIVINPRLVQWFNDWDGSVSSLLIGPSGCGKSLTAALAAASTYQWIRRVPSKPSVLSVARTRPDGAFLRGNQVTRWVRAEKLSRVLANRDTAPEIDKFIEAPLLVIDELGYERFFETILEVIGTRSELGRPTVATSGSKYADLEARYSDATVRRLAKHKSAMLVDCHGKSPSVKIAPRWPVIATVTRRETGQVTGGHHEAQDAQIANPDAANRIRDFIKGF